MEIAIVGGGPAGLRAAQVAAAGTHHVTLYEGKPSVGRKFLIAGRGGLNLTHSEPIHQFATRYTGSHSDGYWTSLLDDFDNQALREWAADLGIETFIGTSGRVFPKEFKAAPLLRRWVECLRSLGVEFKVNHRLQVITQHDGRLHLGFNNQGKRVDVKADAVILALGGASWPMTGSDGVWCSLLRDLGIEITPFAPANCGWEVNWNPDILKEAEGAPLKNVRVSCDDKTISGELLITKYGLEGGALYQLGRFLRSQKKPFLTIDLKPSFDAPILANKLTHASGDLVAAAIASWRLGKAAAALLKYLPGRENHWTPLSLAESVKSLAIPLIRPRPIAEAISSAGGIAFSELDESLMVNRLPGLFVAGEMLDWEAPTGGYLLQGSFATGTRAAKGALEFLESTSHRS